MGGKNGCFIEGDTFREAKLLGEAAALFLWVGVFSFAGFLPFITVLLFEALETCNLN